jgi:hypothetical protein
MLKLKKIEFILNILNCLKMNVSKILLSFRLFKKPNFLRKVEILLVKKKSSKLIKKLFETIFKFFFVKIMFFLCNRIFRLFKKEKPYNHTIVLELNKLKFLKLLGVL